MGEVKTEHCISHMGSTFQKYMFSVAASGICKNIGAEIDKETWRRAWSARYCILRTNDIVIFLRNKEEQPVLGIQDNLI